MDLKWADVEGRGRVYSFTIIRHTKANPAFSKDEPFCIVAVELNEGPRMYGTLLPRAEARIGLPVEVFFDDVSSDVTLPKFRPVQSSGR